MTVSDPEDALKAEFPALPSPADIPLPASPVKKNFTRVAIAI
jgi:hypothetical protein